MGFGFKLTGSFLKYSFSIFELAVASRWNFQLEILSSWKVLNEVGKNPID